MDIFHVAVSDDMLNIMVFLISARALDVDLIKRSAKVSLPAVGSEVLLEGNVFQLQIGTVESGDEEESDDTSNKTKNGGDDKSPSVTEVTLNRLEHLGTDGGTSLTDSSRETVESTSHSSGVGLGRDETQHVSGTEVTSRGKHAVHEHKGTSALLEGGVRTSNNEADNNPQGESDQHGVLSAKDLVLAHVGANKDTGETNGTDKKLPLGSLEKRIGVVGVDDSGDNGTGEDTVGEDDEIVKEPGSGGTDDSLPVVLEDKQVRNSLLDGRLGVKTGLGHLQSEVEDGQRPDTANTHAGSPNCGEMLSLESASSVDNEEDDDTEGVTEREGQVCAHDKSGTSSLSQMSLVGGFGG